MNDINYINDEQFFLHEFNILQQTLQQNLHNI